MVKQQQPLVNQHNLLCLLLLRTERNSNFFLKERQEEIQALWDRVQFMQASVTTTFRGCLLRLFQHSWREALFPIRLRTRNIGVQLLCHGLSPFLLVYWEVFWLQSRVVLASRFCDCWKVVAQNFFLKDIMVSYNSSHQKILSSKKTSKVIPLQGLNSFTHLNKVLK